MIQQRNNMLWHKTNGLIRYLMVHLGTSIIPLYVVNEYPKSGGTWLGQMIAAALDIPFPRNRLPLLKSCIMHGHYLRTWNMKNVVVLWRDGRDVIVSQYYHSLFENNIGNRELVKNVRKDLLFDDYDDIKRNLTAFIEYVFIEKKHPRFSWSDFCALWENNSSAVFVKYEDLLIDCSNQLQRIILHLTGKQLEKHIAETITSEYSFKRQSGRNPGQEDTGSFLRKGIAGDCKNYFTNESKLLFSEYAGNALIKLGYEKDDSWVK